MRRRAKIAGTILVALLLFLSFWAMLGSTRQLSIEPVTPLTFPAPPIRSGNQIGELAVNADEIDLGRIKRRTQCRFEYTNRGVADLSILGARASCTCTVTQPDKKRLAPGESGHLLVSIEPGSVKPGIHRYAVRLDFEGEKRREALFVLSFTNQPDLVLPQSLSLRAIGSNSATQEFSITDYREKPLRLSRIESNLRGVDVRFVGCSEAYRPGWDLTFVVTVAEDGPIGNRSGAIVLHTTDPAHPHLSIPVTVRRVPRIRVMPDVVTLRLQEDGTYRGKVYLDDIEGHEIGLESAVPSHGSLQCSWDKHAKARQLLTVEFTPRLGTPLLKQSTVRVCLKGGGTTVIEVPVQFRVQDSSPQ